MEPEKYPKVNPGAYALLRKMNPAQLRKMFESDLASVPGAAARVTSSGARLLERWLASPMGEYQPRYG